MKLTNVVLIGGFVIGYLTSSLLNHRSKSILSEENKTLRSTLSQRDSIILDLNTEIDILEEGISVRESEISYWGRMCDSLQEK